MNLRGVKESVTILTPIFLVFLVTHAILIFGAIGTQPRPAPATSRRRVSRPARTSHLSTRRAHRRRAGVHARVLARRRHVHRHRGGVERLAIMREPRVRTAKRTMLLMATSLAITASGILLAYLLAPTSRRAEGQDDERVCSREKFVGDHGTVARSSSSITLVSEGALLFVAAQAGFVDGPRVMANMALDQWMPHRMAALSEQLTMHNGVYLMAARGRARAGLHRRHRRRARRHVQHQRVHHVHAVERRDDPPCGAHEGGPLEARDLRPRPRRGGVRR